MCFHDCSMQSCFSTILGLNYWWGVVLLGQAEISKDVLIVSGAGWALLTWDR